MNLTKILISLAFLIFIGQASAQATHFYRFNEGSGNTAFDSVHTANSVNAILNDATYSNLAKIGPTGTSLSLNGADDSFANFGSFIGQFGKNDFTVAFWFQTTDTSLGNSDLIGNRAAFGHGNFFSVRMNQYGTVSAEVDEDADGTNYIGVKSNMSGLNDGNWHHIAITRSGKTLSLYVDGSLSNSGIGGGVANINNGNAFKLGRSLVEAGTARFAPVALFDDLAFFNKALNDYSVMTLYQDERNK